MKEISIHEININPATIFGKEWCLIAAGNEKNGYNTMTVAWGQLGAVWDRHTPEGKMIIPTATVFIRPQRYTKEFFDREEYFTVCAFGAGYRKVLAYLGTHSGRDGDKRYLSVASCIMRRFWKTALLTKTLSAKTIPKRIFTKCMSAKL